MSRADAPYPIFTGLDNRLLDNGYVWFGVENEDPQTDPIAIYADEAMTAPLAQPLRTKAGVLSDGDNAVNVFIDGAYSVRVRSFAGVEVYYRASVPASDATALALKQDLAAAGGSAEVGFLQAGAGAVARTVQDKGREQISVLDFGATGLNIVDDSPAFLKAFDAAIARGGADILIPRGNYKVGGLNLTYASPVPVTWRGEGKLASNLIAPAGSTQPIMTLDATGVQDVYGGFEDLTFIGSAKAGDGLKLVNIARFALDRVYIRDCANALNCFGALIFEMNDCSINTNTKGVLFRKNGALTPNLIMVRGGEIRDNTEWGIDYGDGLGLVVDTVDFEHNGTPGNYNSGCIVVRDTVDDSIGFGYAVFRSNWFEQNNGTAFKCEPGTVNVTLDQCLFVSNQRDIDIGAIYNSDLRNCLSNGTVNIAAAGNSLITGGQYVTVNDTSSYKIHDGYFSSSGLNYRNLTSAAARWDGDKLAFYGTTPIAKQTGVPVDAAGIHAALVALGLIAA